VLVSTSQAAEILGISLQGVHYRIKKGHLKAKKQDGKTFVYIDKNLQKKDEEITSSLGEIIAIKNEQIAQLNESIVWMKTQYTSEIQRLSDNQDKIIDVFKSEIELLKQAYNEMNSLHKLVDKTKEKPAKIKNTTISIKDFFIYMKRYKKSNNEIKMIILTCIKKEDERFIYSKEKQTLKILKSNFFDLL
jgi:hypothetical protein